MFKDDKRDSIGRRTINGILIFALLLTIAVSVPVTYGFSVLAERNYYENTRDYAGIVSHVVNGDTVPDELLKNVRESIGGFTGDAEQFDDITMLAFRYNGK